MMLDFAAAHARRRVMSDAAEAHIPAEHTIGQRASDYFESVV